MSLKDSQGKKILIINSEYPPVGGGAGNASANIARCLAAFGYEVSVLTVRFGADPGLEVCDGVTIHRIPALRRRQDRSGAVEQFTFIVSACLWVLTRLRRNRPGLTLAFFGMPSGAVAWLIRKLHGIPYIISLRGGDVPGFRPYDFKWVHNSIAPFLRVIWGSASAVVANSRGLRDLALAFDPAREIPIIPNGVDGGMYRDDGRAWSPPRILSAGRVVYQKGFDLGLRALAQLTGLEWEWRIAGDGSQLEALRALANELGISQRVIFLGWLERGELSRCYHQANIFLFPSRHEGMPNAVLEAMASGLPVVATRIAGSEELVLDGETGALVKAEDVDALRESLRSLLTAEKMRVQMGHAARLRVEKEYSWEKAARQYSEIMEKII